MKKLLLKSMLLLSALIVGNSSVWADDYELVTSAPADWTGDYVLVNECSSSASTFICDGTVTGTSFSTASAVKTLSKAGITYNSTTKKLSGVTDAYVLHVAPSSTNGKYRITLKGANTTIYLIANSSTGSSSISSATETTNADWSLSLGTSGNAYLVGKSGRYVGWNSSYFRAYAASNKDTYQCFLFKKASAAEGTTAAPTISGNTPFFGTTEATITNAASADGASIYYTLNGSDPTTTTSATCFEYSDAFNIDATTTVKAIAKKSTDTNASTIVSKTFTKVAPMNVASALTAIADLANNGTITNQSVRGVVTKVTSMYNGTAINYTISDDVAGSNELTVYRGKNMHNTDFAALSDIKLGDDVVIYGTLKKFVSGANTTPEFDAGSYLLYQESKDVPTFTLSTSAETLSMGTTETVDVTLTTNTDGAITCESSDDDVATVALKSGSVYTITGHMAGTATITIKSALTDSYQPASATVEITVEDTRAAAGISFAEDEVEITWGDTFTGQALTNTNSLSVTWSSTDETVATVDASGVVTVVKAGTTDIKASFAGNATYKTAVVEYTLAVNKAEADLSYSQTEFDIMVGDDSFVAPTLNNPNGLTVNYSSSNGTVALVDENTGELTYEEATPGTATITAYFAGNDNYKGGNAKYTINIIDPTIKGCKYNPYTIAEVINGTATGSGIYVTGFIVGEYIGKTTDPRISDFSGNSNLAVADVFNDSPVVANCIPVELPSSPSSIRTNWGLKDNPSKIGYKILFKGNANTYFTVKGIKGTNEISAVSVPVTIASTSGFATFYTGYALDFSGLTSEVKAYTASCDGTTVTLEKVDDIPANTGVVLKGIKKTYDVPVIASSSTAKGDLTGNTSAATAYNAFDGFDLYMLALNGDNEAQFTKVTSGSVAAGKAFLKLSSGADARELNVVFADDEPTAIETVKVEKANNEYFNLAGQRVAQPTKGLYIVNGKKVVVK